MSNKIGWCTDTINPISGCAKADKDGFCAGQFKCYAAGFAKRLAAIEKRYPGRTGYPTEEGQSFRPTFHADKIEDIRNLKGKGKRVFLDSMGDWFSPGVKTHWIARAIDAVESKPDHTFLVLTKRPDRIVEVISSGLVMNTPRNLWIGTSVTCQADVWRIQKLRPIWSKRFISFEPLHGPIKADLSGIHWIIIGSETGNRKGKIIPEVAWIEDLVQEAAIADIPVFMKENLRDFYHAEPWKMIQQFPPEMRA